MKKKNYQIKADDLVGTVLERVFSFDEKSFIEPDYKLAEGYEEVGVMSYFERQLYSVMIEIQKEHDKMVDQTREASIMPKIGTLFGGISIVLGGGINNSEQAEELHRLRHQHDSLKSLLFLIIRQRLKITAETIRLGEGYKIAVYIKPKKDDETPEKCKKCEVRELCQLMFPG